jgi:hypothetical protein
MNWTSQAFGISSEEILAEFERQHIDWKDYDVRTIMQFVIDTANIVLADFAATYRHQFEIDKEKHLKAEVAKLKRKLEEVSA